MNNSLNFYHYSLCISWISSQLVVKSCPLQILGNGAIQNIFRLALPLLRKIKSLWMSLKIKSNCEALLILYSAITKTSLAKCKTGYGTEALVCKWWMSGLSEYLIGVWEFVSKQNFNSCKVHLNFLRIEPKTFQWKRNDKLEPYSHSDIWKLKINSCEYFFYWCSCVYLQFKLQFYSLA